ncbi:MAG: hypothetical protein Q8N10_03460 [Phenylobacterium sp.]|uniref:helix-turn-helix domain-containing protein n=1 Tax=Phenylobacterium sp. TaxID=1871053 RepID=UPI0027270518|nr:hypothetical protein [Phenylobacterium sp.]MDO8912328.1 hypothetical protein [Phenylobacterium sp.]MDP3099540.1 hypothetical protein [Phenylobacterium sp.]
MSATPIQTAEDRFRNDPEFRSLNREGDLRDAVWEAIVKTFRRREREDGLTQAEWAAQARMTPTAISRLMRRPANLTTTTMARSLSALDAYLEVNVVDARQQARLNNTAEGDQRKEAGGSSPKMNYVYVKTNGA